MAKATDKVASGRLKLAELSFDVVHHDGLKLQTTEALSRLRTKRNDKTPLDDEDPALTIRKHLLQMPERRK